MLRQPRPSIVVSDCGDNGVDYPGSDVMIHKKDFLIHIKKLSARSQSSDCAIECRNSFVNDTDFCLNLFLTLCKEFDDLKNFLMS